MQENGAADGRKEQAIDLSRYALRNMVEPLSVESPHRGDEAASGDREAANGERGAAIGEAFGIMLYCPHERAYQFRGEDAEENRAYQPSLHDMAASRHTTYPSIVAILGYYTMHLR